MWQARHVAASLERLHPGLSVPLEVIKTEGDVRVDVPFGDLPGKGFFVKEIEAALISKEIDLAVHSLKDLPSDLPEGLGLAAVLERHDPRDAVLSEAGWTFDDLPEGTVLATGSPRRRTQLLHARPELRATEVRGNVDTRIRKLRAGEFGALILALAGVERLGLHAVPIRPIATSVCLPAVGQGAIAIETRLHDDDAQGRVMGLIHEPTLRATLAERAFLARLGGGCLAPATGFARVENGIVTIRAAVGDPDGRRLLRDGIEGPVGSESDLGKALADRLLELGAEQILERARALHGEHGPE
jgi:hydroxymethylbilane synthase